MVAPARTKLTRADILGAAQDVFAARGYHGTSMDAVAEAVGVTKPILYRHFDSKRALYTALVDRRAKMLLPKLAEVLHGEGVPVERITGGIRAYLEWVDSNRAAFLVLFEGSFADAEAWQRVDRLRERLASEFATLIGEATDLSEQESTMLATAIVGMAVWTAASWARDDSLAIEDVSSLLESAVTAMLAGL